MFAAASLAALYLIQSHVPPTPASGEGTDPALRPPELVEDGPYFFEPTDALEDAPPAPQPAVFETGPDGDVLVTPASGDPYFVGFAAGAHFPPADERIDPELLARLQSTWSDGRPAQETYAFVMFAKRITPQRLAQLGDLGARVLEFHPHYCMKVALAPNAVDALAALDFVRWIGVPKDWQRVHPALAGVIDTTLPGRPVDVWINVYDSDLCAESTSQPAGETSYGGPEGEQAVDDAALRPQVWRSNGWQQLALQELGVEVREYVDDLRAFRCRIQPAALELIAELDFVQFVEPEIEPSLAHDESMPMILADRTRINYDASAAAIAGQVDSGIEYSHQGITGYSWWQNNYTAEPGTDDLCGHGTHVAGTFHGSGAVEDSYEGVANGLGWGSTGRFFNVKHFSGGGCSSSGASLATIMNGLHGAVTDGSGNVTQRPHVVNHSWGTVGGTTWVGTEVDAREIDAETYTYGQLHVWAAGNEGGGGSTLRLQAAAKNAFTVGGVRDYRSGTEDPGHLYPSSSRGPAGDNRWKPNVSAPATNIRSANAAVLNGYTNKSGTSMAAPHVTGLAATLCEHFSFLRYNPPTLGAVLMATALTKGNIVHSAPSASSSSHLNTYGTGRVEALNAHLLTAGTGLYMWGWTQGTSGMNYVDLNVGAGATRLTVCMFYTEPAASSGASQALVNDLDLFLDQPPLSSGATGEWTAQQSSINNVEIRSLNNPVAGTWRLKVNTDSATTNSRVGLCAFISFGDTTPNGSLNVTASDSYVKPNEVVSISAAAYNPSFIASAVFADSTSSGDVLLSSTMTHEDGATANLMNNAHSGRDVLLGDIAPGDTRTVNWTTRWATEGVKTWSVNARSDNWVNKTDSVNITVDGTPPPQPTGLTSTTHTVGQWSNNPNITFVWSQPADPLSGVDGYSWLLSNGVATLPDAVKDINAVTSFSTTLPGTAGNFAFNLRPVDRSGNWSTLLTYTGFYGYDAVAPSPASGLASPSHAAGVQSCNTSVNVTWTAASDAHSGIAGYIGLWDTSPSTVPTGALNLSAGSTSWLTNIGSSTNARYFHLRARDHAGNFAPTVHFGPVLANSASVSTYCTGKVNSLGCTPTALTNGMQPSRSAGNFTVLCTNVVNQKMGFLFWGATPTSAPFQGGTLCVAAPTLRTPSLSSGGSSLPANDCSGVYAFTFSTAYMNLVGLLPGHTRYGQWWMRDPQSPSTTGLSNAVRFTVCQ
jgi:hypothetical protein